MLKAIIFDVDGTLADTERDGHRVAFNAAFREAGLDWEWDAPLYGELLSVTGGKERIQFYLKEYRPDITELPLLKGERLALPEFAAALHKLKTAHYVAMLREEGIPLRPGVKRLLREARAQGLRLAVATTTTPENVSALLKKGLGADGESWFDFIAAGDMVPRKKPAPDIYELALERLGLDAGSCVAMEDSAHGLHSARDAGLKTVVTVNDYTRNQNFAGAALVLSDMGEPDAPFTVLAGESYGYTRLETGLLAKLLE